MKELIFMIYLKQKRNNYIYFCKKIQERILSEKINYMNSIKSIITEKATILSEQNKTVFKVHEKANKKI